MFFSLSDKYDRSELYINMVITGDLWAVKAGFQLSIGEMKVVFYGFD